MPAMPLWSSAVEGTLYLLNAFEVLCTFPLRIAV